MLSRPGLGCFTWVTKFFFTLCGLMPHECAQHEPKFPKVNCVVITAKSKRQFTCRFSSALHGQLHCGNYCEGNQSLCAPGFGTEKQEPDSWKEVSVAELKFFLRLPIAMSIHRAPSLRENLSTDRVLCGPAFSRIIARNGFLEIYTIFILVITPKCPIVEITT